MLGTSAMRIKTVSSVRLAQGARSGQEANAWPTVDDASGGVVKVRGAGPHRADSLRRTAVGRQRHAADRPRDARIG